MNISLQGMWLIGWVILVGLSIVSLVVVSASYRYSPCDSFTPILLSRAFTTDPWRGIVIAANFFAALMSYSFGIAFITLAFILFGCAFVVSMFDTAITHDTLILIGAGLLLLETFPWWSHFNCRSWWWKLHWCTTALSGIACISWITMDDLCSWWYVTEYLFFWQLYLLVYWRISPELLFSDTLRTPRVMK